MEKHVLKMENFLGENVQHMIAAHSSSGFHKSLGIINRIDSNGTITSKFIVEVTGNEVFETAFLDKAIEFYNNPHN